MIATESKKARDRAAGRAGRLQSLSRRYAILAAYLRGEKVEAIASAHGVTTRLISHYAALEGIQRRQGRPRKAPAMTGAGA